MDYNKTQLAFDAFSGCAEQHVGTVWNNWAKCARCATHMLREGVTVRNGKWNGQFSQV